MEKYFEKYRLNTIGNKLKFKTPNGTHELIYADWIASGRLYGPIEDKIKNTFGPWVGNTHTETSETGTRMTKSYHYAHKIIKEHVNANSDDAIITSGFGMTSAVVKFQRILGMKQCGNLSHSGCLLEKDRPVVFVTHMEHHSNHTSWFETMSDVIQLQPDKDLFVDLDELRAQLIKYKDRSLKIGAFTACSNVTGIETPIHEMAKIMHENDGYCFVDYAASAPYVDINMHPDDPLEKLDAIMFSPHKFLGGPGSSGVLVFSKSLYRDQIPDIPGGGTVDWTNPWGQYKYIDDIEAREDGDTPGFLQAIRTALAIKLKEQIGTENIQIREHQLVNRAFDKLQKIPGLHILANNAKKRLGIISLYIDNIHFNLLVKLLNDRWGIQVRGGCACAGTYGHFLLDVSHEKSKHITDLISHGDFSLKPGWIRISLHPTMTDNELDIIADALAQIAQRHEEWAKDYIYIPKTNEFRHKSEPEDKTVLVMPWFELD